MDYESDLRNKLAQKLGISLQDLTNEELANLRENLGAFSSDEEQAIKMIFPTISKDSDVEGAGLKASKMSMDSARYSQGGFDASISSGGNPIYGGTGGLLLKKGNALMSSYESMTSGGQTILPKSFPKTAASGFIGNKIANKAKISEKFKEMKDRSSFIARNSPTPSEKRSSTSGKKKLAATSTNLTKVNIPEKKLPPKKSSFDNSTSKVNWNKIFLSEEEYYQLKSKNTDALRSQDIALMQVFERIEQLKNDIRELRNDNTRIKEENSFLKEDLSHLRLQREKIESIKDGEIHHFHEKNIELEAKVKKLVEQNSKLSSRLEDAAPKVARYDELMQSFNNLKKDFDKANETINTQLNLILTSKREKEEVSSQLDFSKIELENLKNDKFFMSKENMNLTEKMRYAEDKIKSMEEEIRDTRKANNSYIEKLTDKNINLNSIYETNMKKEVEEMKAKYNQDLDNLRKVYEEIAEKRTQYLREEKDDLNSKINKLENQLKYKEESYEFLSTELRQIQRRTDEDISMLKVQLKVKSEELDRVANLYEENFELIKVLKNENEMFKEKNDILRIELITKEAQFKENQAENKAQLVLLREKIESYEQVENELDKVIVDSAYEKDNEVMSIIKDIPTANKRRISQCLILANKLKLSNIEIEKYKGLSKKLEDEITKLNEEKEVYRSVVDKSKQPSSYLIKNIETLEFEIFKKDKIIEEKDVTIKSLTSENKLLVDKASTLETDIKVVLNNRSKLDSLEDVIIKFIKDDQDKSETFKSLMMSNNNPNLLNLVSPSSNQAERDYNNMSNKFNNSINPGRSMASNNTNYDSKMIGQAPNWYMNLKQKMNR